MNTLRIILPLPPKETSPNARVHWAARAQAAKLARSCARVRTLVALRRCRLKVGVVPTGYLIMWVFKGRMPDADNVLARCKAYLDGVCDALGVDDGTLDCLGISRVHFRDYADNPRVGLLTPGVRIKLLIVNNNE